jgi:hypothetical protein
MNHQIVNPEFDARHMSDVSVEAAETYIRAAQRRMESDRAAGMASLDDMFRSGHAPRAMDGRYQGELVAVDIAPGITQYATYVQNRFRPWHGKTFDASGARGDNIFDNQAGPWFRVLMPFYRGRRPDSAGTFRAFDFRTYVAPALRDPGVAALKIDYDLPDNPGLSIRRVLDELVELADGYYLGRAYVRWWWGSWQRVAYFSLRMNND